MGCYSFLCLSIRIWQLPKFLRCLFETVCLRVRKYKAYREQFSPDTHLRAISLWCCFHWSVNKMRMLSILLNAIIIHLKHCCLRFPFPTFLVLKLLFLWHIMLVLGRGCCCCLFVCLFMNAPSRKLFKSRWLHLGTIQIFFFKCVL